MLRCLLHLFWDEINIYQKSFLSKVTQKINGNENNPQKFQVLLPSSKPYVHLVWIKDTAEVYCLFPQCQSFLYYMIFLNFFPIVRFGKLSV